MPRPYSDGDPSGGEDSLMMLMLVVWFILFLAIARSMS